MKLKKISLLAFCFILVLVSCNKDEVPTIPEEILRDRKVQQIADNDSILKYLNNHYYNSEDLASISNPGLNDIVITKLVEGVSLEAGQTLLIDAVGESKKVKFQDTDYEFYVLKINQGGGDAATIGDNIQVLYEGFSLTDYVFDFKYFPNNTSFDLTGVIAGWRKVLPDFNTAEYFLEDIEGTTTFLNTGLGVMFLPSGLAYFSGAPTGVSSYAPLVFKFELLALEQNDHDADGIPTYLEDLDGDGELKDNTDSDTYFDSFGFSYPRYNYIDTDDDGDGILTKDEIVVTTINKATKLDVKNTVLENNQVLLNKIVKESNGTFTGTIITFTDANENDTPDYLEKN